MDNPKGTQHTDEDKKIKIKQIKQNKQTNKQTKTTTTTHSEQMMNNKDHLRMKIGACKL